MSLINLSGTKAVIFDKAVKQIFDAGYENINMRTIAKECNIKAASIYYYYASKQEILDTAYLYYEEHFYDNQKSAEEIKKLIACGTKEEIIKAFAFTFESSDERKYQRMIMITKIIYFRMALDERARNIFLNLMTETSEKLITGFLDYGVSVGRFKPFDTQTFSSLLTGSRHILGIKAFIRPDYTVAQLEEENQLNAMFAGFLPFKE